MVIQESVFDAIKNVLPGGVFSAGREPPGLKKFVNYQVIYSDELDRFLTVRDQYVRYNVQVNIAAELDSDVSILANQVRAALENYFGINLNYINYGSDVVSDVGAIAYTYLEFSIIKLKE